MILCKICNENDVSWLLLNACFCYSPCVAEESRIAGGGSAQSFGPIAPKCDLLSFDGVACA
jgi:hypothetical protein